MAIVCFKAHNLKTKDGQLKTKDGLLKTEDVLLRTKDSCTFFL